MNKKQLIAAWVFSILITVIAYGSGYADTQIIRTVKSPYTGSLFDKMIYKKIVLPGGDNRPVLVKRITGEVKYILVDNKQWLLLTGVWKEQCQAKYDALVASKKNKPSSH